MIDFRCISFSGFIVIFNLLINPISYATSLRQTKQNNSIEIAEISEEYEASMLEQKQSIILSQENNLEQPEENNNHLSLLGIGATSVLFIAVLIMLFREEKQSKTAKIEELYRDNLDIKTENGQLLEAKNLVFQPEFSKPNTEIKEDFDYDLNPNHQPTEAIQLEINKPRANGVSVGTLEEAKYSTEPEPIVNSDIMGKLTIVASSTTEIDVVSELIQDLQINSTPNSSATQRDLRRKAIWELGHTNDFRAVKPLIQTISQVDSLEKNLILDSITKIANHSLETVNDILLASLGDERVEVRKNAIQDLTSLYHSMSLITVHLSKMTEDSDKEVQQTAKWALAQFKKMSIPVASIEHTEGEK